MRSVNNYIKIAFYLHFLFISSAFDSYGQSDGLGFYSHEVVQDKRTSLDLTPGKTLCFRDNFDISFEMSLFPNHIVDFGYIVRIIENDTRNIDLVHSVRLNQSHFDLIVGDKPTKIAFDIDSVNIFNHWDKLIIKFDFPNDRLMLYSDGRQFVEKGLHLKKNACYKIIFGGNNYKQFQTTDIPPMKLRDIRISQNGLLKYDWPLNEESDLIAHEVVSQNDGAVINPEWMTALHRDWQPVPGIDVDGVGSVAFDPKKEIVYIIGADTLFSYSVSNSSWSSNAYAEGKLILNRGNQAFYDPRDGALYYIYKDTNFIARYNFTTRSWSRKFEAGLLTDFWHFNKLVSSTDTSLYMFGGYGHLVYKNAVQRYQFNTHTWQKVVTKGDFFTPRYLASLGSTANGDTAYILGGYGNASGQQILNPRNMYDLMRFTVKDKTFKKLFELNVNGEDFAFANSLVIDAGSGTYYGLIFPQHKYNSSLQLIRGSLKKPEYTLLGGSIPYSFFDTHSFADLYYCPQSKRFVAVTLLQTDDNRIKVNIFTLMDPPYGAGTAKSAGGINYWYIALLIAALTGLILFTRSFIPSNKPQTAAGLQTVAGAQTAAGGQTIADSQTEAIATPARIKIFNNEGTLKSSILLFGNMQVFDAEGADITRHFTPLIRELFLVILLYSIRWDRGLSSEKLNEILWRDKSAKSARNNRSVNIAKLKTLLDKMGYCHLSKETGNWKIDIDFDHFYVDYHNYLLIVKDKQELDAARIKCLSDITQRGNFLSNIEYEWLDTFKSDISNEVIDTYLHFVQSGAIANDPEMMIEVAGYIFYFDPVNEEAMILKCKALSALGKHSLAKNAFENFSKEYRIIYGEEFKKDFHTILE